MGWMRAVMVMAMLLVVAPARAEEAPWQATIEGQIEAFRQQDAAGAFGYAAQGFHATFPSAETFFSAILQSGYGPIMESRSHSFGMSKKLDDGTVAQQVRLVGPDQGIYEATYQLVEEDDGWRVLGVRLIKVDAIGI